MYFPNAKEAEFQYVTVPNLLLSIKPLGQILYMLRWTATYINFSVILICSYLLCCHDLPRIILVFLSCPDYLYNLRLVKICNRCIWLLRNDFLGLHNIWKVNVHNVSVSLLKWCKPLWVTAVYILWCTWTKYFLFFFFFLFIAILVFCEKLFTSESKFSVIFFFKYPPSLFLKNQLKSFDSPPL